MALMLPTTEVVGEVGSAVRTTVSPTAADPLDECEKGETCQAEPWLGGLWGSKMVLLFVLLNFSDGLIDDETDAMAALFCCCCVAALSCMTVALGQTISHSCWCVDLLELSGVIDLPPCDEEADRIAQCSLPIALTQLFISFRFD